MQTFFGRDTHVRPVSALVSSPHRNILRRIHTIYIFQMNFQLEESSPWMFTQYDVDGTRSEPENQYFPSSPQLSATILHVQLYVKQYEWHLTHSHIYMKINLAEIATAHIRNYLSIHLRNESLRFVPEFALSVWLAFEWTFTILRWWK